MFLLYSILLSIGFLLMLPSFFLRRQKYAEGLRQRLGRYPTFIHDGRPVIWLHCVSVGETNAARPLVVAIRRSFPDHRLVVSTITQTGQALAQKVFTGKADSVFYFPFDWKFSVKRALDHFRPSVVMLMETEIWPRFVLEAGKANARIAIVNGRLSERSFRRYRLALPLFGTVFRRIDLALMQTEKEAGRILSLGVDADRVSVTGNLKFDIELAADELTATSELGKRFSLSQEGRSDAPRRPLIVAASTHEPEERIILEAYCSVAAGKGQRKPKLLIAPRHPERFEAVERMANDLRNDPSCEWPQFSTVLRSDNPSANDAAADVIILDSIGELRAVYPLADIVFVGGSLIPHGGQSVLEPAAAGKAIVTGSHTKNFEQVVRAFLENDAIVQLPDRVGAQMVDELFDVITDLLDEPERLEILGHNALAVMNANRGATGKTIAALNRVILSRRLTSTTNQ
mgnify:CR=1 FL=1